MLGRIGSKLAGHHTPQYSCYHSHTIKTILEFEITRCSMIRVRVWYERSKNVIALMNIRLFIFMKNQHQFIYITKDKNETSSIMWQLLYKIKGIDLNVLYL